MWGGNTKEEKTGESCQKKPDSGSGRNKDGKGGNKNVAGLVWEGESDVPQFLLWADEEWGGGEILSHGDSIRMRNVNRLSQSRAGTVCEQRGRQHRPKIFFFFGRGVRRGRVSATELMAKLLDILPACACVCACTCTCCMGGGGCGIG